MKPPRKPGGTPRLQRRGGSGAGPGAGPGVVQGLLLIARGRREGLDCFGSTPDAFLSALSPWLAFLLVGALLMLLRQPSQAAATLFLLSFCALLLPPVLSHALARFWQRSTFWLRYATAAVWCEWLVIFAYAGALVVVMVMLELGVPSDYAGIIFIGLVACYWLWLHWFLAWRGLAVSGLRAAVLVGVLVLATAGMAAAAELLPPYVGMFGFAVHSPSANGSGA